MKLRLFVGITAPAAWKQAISQWRGAVQPRFSDSFARWTSDDNLHLTLRFFGSVEEQEAVVIGEALQKVATDTCAFSLSPGSLGCFPSISRPRIVWLGFKGAAGLIIDLEARVRKATAAYGKAPEDRAFHPHLTVARVNESRRSDRELLGEFTRKEALIDVPAWPVPGIDLIRSELKSSGSVYTTLATYAFEG